MFETIEAQLANLSKREKIIMGVIAAFILIYFTFTVFFQNTYKEITKIKGELKTVTNKFKKLERVRGQLQQLTRELGNLNKELKLKEGQEVAFKESLQARNQIGKVLQTLETTAQQIPMKLLVLEADTKIVSRKGQYQLEKKEGDSEDKASATAKKKTKGGKTTGTVQLHFIQNKIQLEYQSDFVATVEFINKILQLPYALSILSVDMSLDDGKGSKRRVRSAGAIQKGPIEINSKINMEIYFK